MFCTSTLSFWWNPNLTVRATTTFFGILNLWLYILWYSIKFYGSAQNVDSYFTFKSYFLGKLDSKHHGLVHLTHSDSILLLILDIWDPLACFHLALIWNCESYRKWVWLVGRVISPSQGRYLHRTIQTQQKRAQTSMPCVGFEATIPAFERAKTDHASDRAATVICPDSIISNLV
jgi:hypothetical protein